MLHDCGTTKPQPRCEPAFRAVLRGWAAGEDLTELMVLAHTPGIPRQWLYGVFEWTALWRRRFNVIFMSPTPEILAQGVLNAATVVQGDGLAMLAALGPYHGQVPLWSTLDLQQDPRSDRVIAESLGLVKHRITVWRRARVFDPLTGGRLVAEVGLSNSLCTARK